MAFWLEPAAPADGWVILWFTNDHVRLKPQSLWLQATVISHTVSDSVIAPLFEKDITHRLASWISECNLHTRKMKTARVRGGNWGVCSFCQEAGFLKRSRSGV